MQHLLVGKTCVVTGSAAGIGLAVARMLAAEGASVALIDRDTQVSDRARELQGEYRGGAGAPHESLATEGASPGDSSSEVAEKGRGLKDGSPEIVGHVVDVTDRDAVFECFTRITDRLGPIYGLVNAAGIVDNRPFDEITPEVMDRVMRVNVHGTLYCCQAAVASMRTLGNGRIVNFSSKSGKTGSALMAAYSAAKGAIIALTHSLAFELAPDNIKVNCLCPGIVQDTGVWNSVSAGYIKNLDMSRRQVIDKFTAKVPLGRLAQIDDIVQLVRFLVVHGDYCTGQALNVSGGREVH